MSKKWINFFASLLSYALVFLLAMTQEYGGSCAPSMGIFIIIFLLPLVVFINFGIQAVLFWRGVKSGIYAMWLNFAIIAIYAYCWFTL